MSFEDKLAQGKIGESHIANWLKARGNAVLPVYEKEIDEGKGPVLFVEHGEYIAPDMLVFPLVEWVEAKHKTVWTWHNNTKCWTTGIDKHHFESYQHAQRESGRRVWLFFLHRSSRPHARDLKAGCPAECPIGLFGGSLDKLKGRIHHEHMNHGRHGMVYWALADLRCYASLEEVLEAA